MTSVGGLGGPTSAPLYDGKGSPRTFARYRRGRARVGLAWPPTSRHRTGRGSVPPVPPTGIDDMSATRSVTDANRARLASTSLHPISMPSRVSRTGQADQPQTLDFITLLAVGRAAKWNSTSN
jgi:hypothetical protein